jgi:hypothetical protein
MGNSKIGSYSFPPLHCHRNRVLFIFNQMFKFRVEQFGESESVIISEFLFMKCNYHSGLTQKLYHADSTRFSYLFCVFIAELPHGQYQ